jgi:hypothetical protein
MVQTLKRKLVFTLSSAMLLSMWIVAIAHCAPGISVTITAVNPFITRPSDTATYIVNVISETTEDENVRLTVSGDPDLGFNWTTKEFVLAIGTTESFGLEATYSGTTAGDYAFTVLGEAWPLGFTYEEAEMFMLTEISSYTDYVHVPPEFVIPEVPLGTVMAGASMIIALVAYITMPRLRRKQRHAI